MKVLITGGYGFIGSHVADRFHQEGYDVFIIDNLRTGKKENIIFKHKGYILSVEDTKCAEVFKSHKFDVVVHLAAQVSVSQSIINPLIDTESNLLGLVNILSLSEKYKVKKFIYASSAAVYGFQNELPIGEEAVCSPVSPYGISKVSGELYCGKWQELYDIQTLGFRFSNVYGPRQDSLGEGGVISTFMERAFTGQPLIVYGDGEQTRDFIYVEDVAFAIYRSVNSSLTGVYNLSVNQQTSVNRIIDILNEIQTIQEVNYTQKRTGDIDHSRLDNRKVMSKLDWSPLYTIEEGLSRTAIYFMNEVAEKQTAVAIQKPAHARAKKTFRMLLPSIENIAAFVLVAWLTLIYANNAYGMVDVKLFYIAVIGILYGSRQAMLAVVLSSCLFIYQKLLSGRDLISLTYDTDFFFQISIYLFLGLVVGYTIERKNSIIQQQELKVNEISNRYEFLDSIYTEVREVKDELQSRILNSDDSYGKIYSATKELESLEPEHVFNSAVNVVKTIMKAPQVMIYMVNPNQTYLRLLASSGYEASEMSKSIKVSDCRYVTYVLQTGKIYTNRNLDDDGPLMAAPIFYNNEITAIIAVDGLAFENFSLYHQNLFSITIDLISSALSKAFTYIAATESQRYIEHSIIMKPEVFKEILTSKIHAFELHQVPYLLLYVELNQLTHSEAAEFLSTKLRETDYIGMGERDGDLLILLSNTSQDDMEQISNRLAHGSLTYSTVMKESIVMQDPDAIKESVV